MAAKIFIADDNEDYVFLFREALVRLDEHHQCMSAENGYQALTQLKFMLPAVPDFIFIDVKMPIMNGHEIVSEIKKIPALQDITIVMLSAVDNPADRERARRAGVMHYYVKPSSQDDINLLLADLLDTKNSR